jgi:hypothetical protein
MANRYWVGGAGNWDTNAGSKWALTSGGAGGQAVPTTSDDVFFDAASGAVAVSSNGFTTNCRNLDFTGFTGSMVPGTTNITGNVTFGAGMTFPGGMGSGTAVMTGAAAQFTCNGKEWLGQVTYNAVGGTLTIMDDFACNGSLNLTNGTIDCATHDPDMRIGGILNISGANSGRVLNMGDGTWYLGGVTATPTNIAPSTGTVSSYTLNVSAAPANVTVNLAGSEIVFPVSAIGNEEQRSIASFGFTWPKITYENPGILFVGGTAGTTVDELVAIADQPTEIWFQGGQTFTANAIDLVSPAGEPRVITNYPPGAAAAVLSVASGTVAFSNAIISNISATGGAAFVADGTCVDGGGNSGITFAPPDISTFGAMI